MSNVTVGTVRKSIAIVTHEVLAQERPPRLRRRTTRAPRRPRHVLGDRVLVDAVTELREFACDPPTAPERVFTRHLLDEAHQLRRERASSHRPRLPRPE